MSLLLLVSFSLLQHMLATFRSTRVSSMSCELNEQSASLKVTLRCDNGESSTVCRNSSSGNITPTGLLL
jgi:hypothetical protein